MHRRRRPKYLDNPNVLPAIPWQYAGQWVAVDPKTHVVLAAGDTLDQAVANATAAGHRDYALDVGPSIAHARSLGLK